MKTFLPALVVIGLFATSLNAIAEADKVLITAQKKHAEPPKGQASNGGPENKGSEKVVYELKLQNQALADLSQLTVEYVIFVERQKLGAKLGEEGHMDRVTGSKTIDVLSNRAPQTITTDEFQLNKGSLGGGYVYTNGGRLKAEDTVAGVWVRVSQNGQLIGEYTNPPTVTKRGWDKK